MRRTIRSLRLTRKKRIIGATEARADSLSERRFPAAGRHARPIGG